MQTFLPFAEFRRSAEVLDQRRLGKQRVEVIQVVRALTVPGYGCQHHPAVLMWRGHEEELASAGALPPWLGDPAVHRSHRSALLRKDPAWYRRFFPDEPDNLDHVWPVRSRRALDAERRAARGRGSEDDR